MTEQDIGNVPVSQPATPDGGAGMAEPDAPAGVTAEVGGSGPNATSDEDEIREFALPSSQHGPVSSAERAERGMDDPDVRRTD